MKPVCLWFVLLWCAVPFVSGVMLSCQYESGSSDAKMCACVCISMHVVVMAMPRL